MKEQKLMPRWLSLLLSAVLFITAFGAYAFVKSLIEPEKQTRAAADRKAVEDGLEWYRKHHENAEQK